MCNIYFDSGTSNSRAYLVDENLKVLASARKNIGSKDSAIAGNNTILINGLKELYDSVLEKAGVEDAHVKGIYASGMVTSPYGICHVPHLLTPFPLKSLAENMYIHYENHRFSKNIHLIRGVRTGGYLEDINAENVEMVSNMRGEEMELLGITTSFGDCADTDGCVIINPGSHTHISYVRDGVLEDVLSTFSGELYHAIITNTIIAGAVDQSAPPDFEAAVRGWDALLKYGINRALYICHSQRVFEVGTPAGRHGFLEGIIAGGIVSLVSNLCRCQWKGVKKAVIAQNGNASKVLTFILKKALPEADIIELGTEIHDSFALLGFKELLRMQNH